MKHRKLYAYSDDDGYIHWNILKGESIWNRQTRTWLKRERWAEVERLQGLMLRAALLIMSLTVGLMLLTGGK